MLGDIQAMTVHFEHRGLSGAAARAKAIELGHDIFGVYFEIAFGADGQLLPEW